jgi:hypothetical protein
MTHDAGLTDLSDPDAASRALAAMGAHAMVLADTINGLVGRLSQLESGKPWGTTVEFGCAFEAVYRAGQAGNGSEFVKSSVDILCREVVQGVTAANRAVRTTVEVDGEMASTYFVVPDSFMGAANGSGPVATGMAETLTEIQDQQQHAKAGG